MKTDELFVDDSYPSDDALSEIEKKAACDESQTAEDGFPDMENTFQLYWEEVSRIPCLAAEQERKLFLRIAEGDEKAKNDVNESPRCKHSSVHRTLDSLRERGIWSLRSTDQCLNILNCL